MCNNRLLIKFILSSLLLDKLKGLSSEELYVLYIRYLSYYILIACSEIQLITGIWYLELVLGRQTKSATLPLCGSLTNVSNLKHTVLLGLGHWNWLLTLYNIPFFKSLKLLTILLNILMIKIKNSLKNTKVIKLSLIV